MDSISQYYLIRQASTPQGTFGALFDKEKKQLCVMVERPWLDNQPRISCIPTGSYTVQRYESPSKGPVFSVLDVPGRSDIEIHAANWFFQLEGCIAVGDSIEQSEYFGAEYPEYTGKVLPAVLNSVDTLRMLLKILPSTFILTIS